MVMAVLLSVVTFFVIIFGVQLNYSFLMKTSAYDIIK
jgi:hypothetical protein